MQSALLPLLCVVVQSSSFVFVNVLADVRSVCVGNGVATEYY